MRFFKTLTIWPSWAGPAGKPPVVIWVACTTAFRSSTHRAGSLTPTLPNREQIVGQGGHAGCAAIDDNSAICFALPSICVFPIRTLVNEVMV